MWKPWQNHQRQGEWQPLSHIHGESLSILSKYASSPSICSQNGVGKKGHLCLTPRMDLTSPDVSPFLHTFAHIVMYSIWLSQLVYKWIGDNHRSDEVTRKVEEIFLLRGVILWCLCMLLISLMSFVSYSLLRILVLRFTSLMYVLWWWPPPQKEHKYPYPNAWWNMIGISENYHPFTLRHHFLLI